MKRGGFLLLLLAFGILAVVWSRREEKLQTDSLHVYDHPLLGSLRPERVRTIRIDQVERGWQMRLERDARASWFLTDPLAFPANDELVGKLLTVLARERGPLRTGADLEDLGLAPPRVVVELVEGDEEGTRTHRLEVGSLDVDPLRVYVRVPGHPAAGEGSEAAILRVSRAVDNTLQRNPDDFRDTRITPFLGPQVQRFERSSKEDPALDMVALRTSNSWRSAGEETVALDPGAVDVLVRCAAELRSRAFVDDREGTRERHGFDQPEFSYRLTTRSGESIEVDFKRNKRGRWRAMRSDLDVVFEPQGTDVELLRRPLASLLDHAAVRWLREHVQRITLERASGSLVLLRSGESEGAVSWSVETEAGRFPADIGRVEDLLAALEQLQVAAFAPGASLAEEDVVAAFRVEADDGATFIGALGPAWSDPSTGVAGELYRRGRETVVGLVEPGMRDVLDVSLDELRPRQTHRIPERFVDRVTLVRGADEEQVYLRSGGDWHPHGLALSASTAFLDLLDPLLALRVTQWLDETEAGPLAPAVRVELRGSFGNPMSFTLGRLPDGRAAVDLEGGSRALVEETLVADLLALFESS